MSLPFGLFTCHFITVYTDTTYTVLRITVLNPLASEINAIVMCGRPKFKWGYIMKAKKAIIGCQLYLSFTVLSTTLCDWDT